MDNVSQCNSARRAESMIHLLIDALPAETTIVEAALPAGMMALPRPATTATSPATSPESAVSPAATAVIADQEADLTSKYYYHNSNKIRANFIEEEVASVVAVVAAILVAEVAEEAVTLATADPDTAAAAPEAPALLPDVMIAEDPEVAAATEYEGHEQESSVQSCKIDSGVLLRPHTARGADVIQSHKDRDRSRQWVAR